MVCIPWLILFVTHVLYCYKITLKIKNNYNLLFTVWTFIKGFNFEKGKNINLHIWFSCQGIFESSTMSWEYFSIIVMSSMHNTTMYLLVVYVFSCALQGLSICSFTKSFERLWNIHFYTTSLNRIDSQIFVSASLHCKNLSNLNWN